MPFPFIFLALRTDARIFREMPPKKRAAKQTDEACCSCAEQEATRKNTPASKRQLTIDAFFAPRKHDEAVSDAPLSTAHRPIARPRMEARLAKFVGAHVSAAGGVHCAFDNARAVGARAFALFLKNQRRWDSPPLTAEQAALFKKSQAAGTIDLSKLLPHGSYLINLGNPDDEKRQRSFSAFVDDLGRCQKLGIQLYNLHPGSTVGECQLQHSIGLIASAINKAHALVPDVCVVLETMAGQGSCVGNRFEDIRDIIALVEDKARVGVCIDTCHIFAAGYDIRTEPAYARTMDAFAEVVGFKYLRGVHLNDSMTPLGSGKDRHENIGKGHIGTEAFRLLMNDPRFDGIPMVLETPVPEGKTDEDVYAKEIDMLYGLVEGTD